MTGTKNLLRIDDKRFKQFVTFTRKPGGGVAGVPVAKLL